MSARPVLVLGLGLLAVGLLACAGDDGDAGAGPSDDEGDDDEGETGEPAAAGDRCEASVRVDVPSVYAASLRHAEPDPEASAASCGLLGPTVFVELGLETRADVHVEVRGRAYAPKFAVMLPGCVDDPSRVLACGQTLPVTLGDLGPDARLLVAIGLDPDDPALELPAPETADDPDPLDFELDLAITPVLAEHDHCGPGLGRCEAGTVCLAQDEDGVAIDRCRRPPADSCVAPGELAVPLPGSAAVVEIVPDEPHSDAHTHACTGWRRPERVEQLVIPEGLGDAATLVVHADDPRVGLALREPSCLPEATLACAPATGEGDGTTLSHAAPGQAPLLFIELPRTEADEPLAPITVTVELLD